MHLINETRVVRLTSRSGATVEGRERIVGIDARWSGRGLVYERHALVEVTTMTAGNTQTVPFASRGPMQRLLPFVAAPVLAIMVKQLFRAKG